MNRSRTVRSSIAGCKHHCLQPASSGACWLPKQMLRVLASCGRQHMLSLLSCPICSLNTFITRSHGSSVSTTDPSTLVISRVKLASSQQLWGCVAPVSVHICCLRRAESAAVLYALYSPLRTDFLGCLLQTTSQATRSRATSSQASTSARFAVLLAASHELS